MKLALFDLDHTLLPVDSADNWLRYLVRVAGLDAEAYDVRIRGYADAYGAGRFDVEDYLRFQMGMLTRFPRPQLEWWRAQYLRDFIFPNIRLEALELVDGWRRDGYTTVLITGTTAFISRPITAAFGLDHLLAVEPEQIDGRYTGRYTGTHTHMEGKVRAVDAFMGARGMTLDECADSVFYSDSFNDLPLLSRVRRPIATNADARLRAVAAERGWPIVDLFETVH
jgi:HAD superfamily hydrolase (TIGR01490 family)